jgi:hypothetical protein
VINVVSSDEEEDGEDHHDVEDTALRKLSTHDEPGWLMGTNLNTVTHCKETFQQNLMRLDRQTKPEWGDPAKYICVREIKNGMAELMVPAIVQLQTDTSAAEPLVIIFEEMMQSLDIVPRQLLITEWTFQAIFR